MNNTFYLKGTLELTGDPELVKANIHQTVPMVDNLNGFRILDGVERKHDDADFETKLILPAKLNENFKIAGEFSGYDLLKLNQELDRAVEAMGLDTTPNEEKLVLPLLYRASRAGNWKWNLLKSLERHMRMGFSIFDVATDNVGEAAAFRGTLENLMHSEELYMVASRSNRVYSYAKAVNPTKWCEKIDLSECTDIEILDTLKLTPRYTLDKPAPKMTANDFVEAIVKKQE